MGKQKAIGKFRREQKREEAQALHESVKNHPLYKEVDGLVSNIEKFYQENEVIQGELAKQINEVRKEGEASQIRIRKEGDAVIQEMQNKIFLDYEAKLFENKFACMKKEYDILLASKLHEKDSREEGKADQEN